MGSVTVMIEIPLYIVSFLTALEETQETIMLLFGPAKKH